MRRRLIGNPPLVENITWVNEIVSRPLSVKVRDSIRTPLEANWYLRTVIDDLGMDMSVENFFAVPMNSKCEVIAVQLVSKGNLEQAIVHPREVFVPALLSRAGRMIIAHNHPSGSVEFSEDDFAITKRLEACGELLGIKILDHILLSSLDNSYRSMREVEDARKSEEEYSEHSA